MKHIKYVLLISSFSATLNILTTDNQILTSSIQDKADEINTADTKAIYPSTSNILAKTVTVTADVTINNNAYIAGTTTSKNIIATENVTCDKIKLNSIEKNGITVNWPTNAGKTNEFLGCDGNGNLIYSTPKGQGNVLAEEDFTKENALLITDIPNGGKNIGESDFTVDCQGNLYGINELNATTFKGNLEGNVSGNLTGNVTGKASQNVLKAGDIMTGDLTVPNIYSNLVGNVQGNVSGNLTGNVTGNLNGSVIGNVTGNLTGNVAGQVTGAASQNVLKAGDTMTGDLTVPNIYGNLVGNVQGNVSGNLIGNVTGNITGDLTGDVEGDLHGTVYGNIYGNVEGNVIGNVTGAASANLLKAGDKMLGTLAILASTSATNPALTITGDTDTGIYSSNANEFGITTNGTAKIIFDANSTNLKSAPYLNGTKTFDLTVANNVQEPANTLYAGNSTYAGANAISLTSALIDENNLMVFLDFGSNYLGRILMIYNSSATGKKFLIQAGSGYTISGLETPYHTVNSGECLLLIGVDGGNWMKL